MLLKDSKRVLMEISQTARDMSYPYMPQKTNLLKNLEMHEKMGIKNAKRWGYCRDVTRVLSQNWGWHVVLSTDQRQREVKAKSDFTSAKSSTSAKVGNQHRKALQRRGGGKKTYWIGQMLKKVKADKMRFWIALKSKLWLCLSLFLLPGRACASKNQHSWW